MSKLKILLLVLLMLNLLTSCAGMTPQLFQTVDDIATDGVIQVQVDKEAFSKNTDISVVVEIKNKDPK